MKQLILGIVLGACGAAAVLVNQSTVAQGRLATDAYASTVRSDGTILASNHCEADITNDGFVDVSDLLELLGAWGPCPGCQVDTDCGPNQYCVSGDCLCLPGFDDCDGEPNNGCEVDTTSDWGHCGGCNIVCGTGEACVNGICVSGCQDVFYRDADGDGWGDCNDFIIACAPSGQYGATICGDCDDFHPSTYPGAIENCNGVDDDCNGTTDDNVADCAPGEVCIDAACITP